MEREEDQKQPSRPASLSPRCPAISKNPVQEPYVWVVHRCLRAPPAPSARRATHTVPHPAAPSSSPLPLVQELYTRLQSSPTPTCRPVLLMFAELVGDAALAASMPTNTLRNAALLPLTTPLVLMADADLSVSSSLTAGGPGTATGCASPGGLLGNATK